MNIIPQWIWPARCIHVVDGDTIDINLDRGFSDWNLKRRVRFALADTYELNDKDPAKRELAKQAKEFVSVAILDQDIVVQSEQWRKSPTGVDSFGRYLMHVYYMREGEQIYLNQELIDLGLAVKWGE